MHSSDRTRAQGVGTREAAAAAVGQRQRLDRCFCCIVEGGGGGGGSDLTGRK
jgi:hypothetical protein